MKPGSIVILHLQHPGEKYWGILESLNPTGATFRGILVASFDDWTHSLAADDEPALGLSTIFVPMQRVEQIFLDEQVGPVEGLCQSFERRVGQTVRKHLGLDES